MEFKVGDKVVDEDFNNNTGTITKVENEVYTVTFDGKGWLEYAPVKSTGKYKLSDIRLLTPLEQLL